MSGSVPKPNDRNRRSPATMDRWLLGAALVLLLLGLVMVASSSIAIAGRRLGEPFYYFNRQLLFVGLGLTLAWAAYQVRLAYWEKLGGALLLAAVGLLVLVLVPGVGREVNGSVRWLPLGIFNLQVSELAKLAAVIYLAGYLVRRGSEVRSSVMGFLKPMSLLALVCLLLLAEPDFGASAVLLTTALGMMFLGGARLWQFAVLLALVLVGFTALAVSSPYRLERLTAFLNPWADPFNSGFQLTQALIAIGRGEWLGVGLGGSVQKLFYLPEAHTDFLFAVLAEELGFAGVVLVVGAFGVLVWRAFRAGAKAEAAGRAFGAYLAYGLAIWVGLQAFINVGVNMGVLPTKGLTLPLMSYGGSSLLVMCVAIGLLLRADYETRFGEVTA